MYNDLSKEDLIKLLQLSNSKLQTANSKLQTANSKLQTANSKLQTANSKLQTAHLKIDKLESEIKELHIKLNEVLKKYEKEQETKRMALARQFCKKSELNSTPVNEAEHEASETLIEVKEAKKRGRKEGFSMKEKFDNLDSNIIREVVNVSCTDQHCTECDSALVSNDITTTYKIEIIPAKIKVIEFSYETKICLPCNLVYKSDSDEDTYPLSSLTPSLGSELLTNKYVLGIPLYRMEDYYFKLGLPLKRQTMANYMIRIASELEPLYLLMKEHLIQNKAKVIHCDETTLKVIKTTDEERSNCYMWVYATSFFDSPIYLYDFQETREQKHVEEFLKGYQGYIVSDGYQVYRNLRNIEMAACFAHARRKFFDIIKALTKEQRRKSKAQEAVDIIDKLFKLEDGFRQNHLTTSKIHKLRQEKSLPILREYENFLNTVDYEKASALGKAIEYSKNLMPNLKTFLKDGHIEISNNLAERAIKPFVIARKNFLFSYSLKGAEASAINFSIIQTSRCNGLDVRKYLEYLLKELPKIKQNELFEYLPWSEKMTVKFRVVAIKR